ncbi:MAG: 5-oxoprolinase subunit PxpA [Acidimicrobiales bacterium]
MPAERRSIDLNADLGEAGDDAGVAIERALLGLVTSAHIACGGHAGDEESMRAIVQAAVDAGVRVGAHPSYPDRAGFGRRPMEMAASDLAASLAAQVSALIDVAASLGAEVCSVKPHGALYGEVGGNASTFDALAGVLVALCEPGTSLVLPSGAPAVAWAGRAGIAVLEEGFADRAYTAGGRLMARQEPGSVYNEPARAAAQALGLAERGTVVAADGTMLTLAVDSLCLHGDSPNALAMARAVRDALAAAGIAVAAPPARRPA